MLKHAACAAAMSSSGFVPGPFSKRVVNEYCVSLSTPLAVEIVPLPCLRSPCQTADAVLFIMADCKSWDGGVKGANFVLSATAFGTMLISYERAVRGWAVIGMSGLSAGLRDGFVRHSLNIFRLRPSKSM